MTNCSMNENLKRVGSQNGNYNHGMTRTRLYRIWQAMKTRCYNQNFTHYKHYGGRGISICDEWLNDFQAFYDWSMSHGYSDDLTIDRIDNDGNYEPSNCRWATKEQQVNNCRHCHYITFNGETHSLSEWSKILNISRAVLNNRINKYGYSVERAFTEPVGTNVGIRKGVQTECVI